MCLLGKVDMTIFGLVALDAEIIDVEARETMELSATEDSPQTCHKRSDIHHLLPFDNIESGNTLDITRLRLYNLLHIMSQSTLRLAFSAARPMRQQDPRLYIQACRSISNSARIQPLLQHRLPIRPSTPVSPVPRREFSRTSPARATVVAKNPRVDDDGKEMTIEISERAAKVGARPASPLRNKYLHLSASEADNKCTASEEHSHLILSQSRRTPARHGNFRRVPRLPILDVPRGLVESR